MDASQIEARVDECASMLGLEKLLDRYPRQLSGGQRQRVAMGRAIAKRSKIFLFDEPLSNLDPALRNQVRVDIRRLHDQLGATSVYVTHDQVEAMTLADQLFVLEGGIVQQTGKPLDIYRRPANRFVASFLGSPAMNFLDGEVTCSEGAVRVAVGDGMSIAVHDPVAFDGLEDGRQVTLGVRPHDVEPVGADEADVSTRASFIETLGPDMNVHASVGGQPFIACLDGESGVTAQDALHLRVTGLHLFDRDGGESLLSAQDG